MTEEQEAYASLIGDKIRESISGTVGDSARDMQSSEEASTSFAENVAVAYIKAGAEFVFDETALAFYAVDSIGRYELARLGGGIFLERASLCKYGHDFVSKVYAKVRGSIVDKCEASDECLNSATHIVEQSTDRGVNITTVRVCAACVEGWNEGGDWDAKVTKIFPDDNRNQKDWGTKIIKVYQQ